MLRHLATLCQLLEREPACLYLAQANGLFFSKSREEGTACRMRAHTAMTCGVILARLLNEPKVTKPLVMAGRGETGGASAHWIVIQNVAQGLQKARKRHLNSRNDKAIHAGQKLCP